MPLSNILKSLRATKDLNQEDMANLLGISRNSYHKKEKCERDFTLEEANFIATYFGKSIEEIFFTRNATQKVHKESIVSLTDI